MHPAQVNEDLTPQAGAAQADAQQHTVPNGIPRCDLHTRPVWKRNLSWWTGGQFISTKTGSALWRTIAAPIEASILTATRGRARRSVGVPIVALTSIGAHTGMRRQTPLAYFTD
jgi:hypothetical protein